MESFYSVSDKHLGLLLWVGTEYLICAVFSCNLSHLGLSVCHCDLFRIFGTWKRKYLKIQRLIASLFHRYVHSCQAVLLSSPHSPPQFCLSSLSFRYHNRLYLSSSLPNKCWPFIVSDEQRPLHLFEMRKKTLANICGLGSQGCKSMFQQL